jgi:peptide methionine sulfoxide reductase MsrB
MSYHNTKYDAKTGEVTITEYTQEEIVTHKQNHSYKDNRVDEYPSIGEQLDYIYHNGVEAWKADMILPVKNKYPKE